MPNIPRSNTLWHKYKNTQTHTMSFRKIHMKVGKKKRKKAAVWQFEALALLTPHQHLFGIVIVKFMGMLQHLHYKGIGGFALTEFTLPMKLFLCCSEIGFLAVWNGIVTRNKKLPNKTWNLQVTFTKSCTTNAWVEMPKLNCLEIIN